MPVGTSPSSTSHGLARACIVAALCVFTGLGVWQSRTFMVWSEEIIVHVMPASEVLAPDLDADGHPSFEPSCVGRGAPPIVHSASRPTLSLCWGDRAWPILIAPYFAGFLYWPFALLRWLHHDNAFALRMVAMPIGALSILVTYKVVASLTGRRAAALAALATGAMPCFLLVHATLVHFESLPWVWMMIALLLFLRLPGFAPVAVAAPRAKDAQADDFPRTLLVGGSFFLGLAIATNTKSVVLIAPLAALAYRLGVPFRRLRRPQWLLAGAAMILPMIPAIALSFAPSVGYSDKGAGWHRTLIAHLVDPSWLWASVKELILLWSNVGFYFGHLVEAPRFNVASAAVASVVLVLVLADTARTLARRRGCPVTAACGVSLVSFTVMVALLYDHFPSNFTPLHTVYAISVGVIAGRLGGALAERAKGVWPLIPVAAIAILPFAWDSVQTIRSMSDVRVHTNADAERSMIAYLGEHAAEGMPVLTADVMIAGVIESLSDGQIRTMRAHNYLSSCGAMVGNASAPACLVDRWRRFLPFGVKSASRLVVPTDWASWGSRHLSYIPSLEQAAQELGYRVTLERTFESRRQIPVLSLYRIEAPAPP